MANVREFLVIVNSTRSWSSITLRSDSDRALVVTERGISDMARDTAQMIVDHCSTDIQYTVSEVK